MILGVQNIHSEIPLRVDLDDLLDVGRARGRHHGLPLEIIDRFQVVRRFLGHEAMIQGRSDKRAVAPGRIEQRDRRQ